MGVELQLMLLSEDQRITYVSITLAKGAVTVDEVSVDVECNTAIESDTKLMRSC